MFVGVGGFCAQASAPQPYLVASLQPKWQEIRQYHPGSGERIAQFRFQRYEMTGNLYKCDIVQIEHVMYINVSIGIHVFMTELYTDPMSILRGN